MVRKLSGGWHKWPSAYNPAANGQAANVARMLKNAEWHHDDWRAGYCETIADNWLEGRHLPRAICTAVREAIADAVGLEIDAIKLPEPVATDPAGLLAYRARINDLADFADHADTRLVAFSASLRKIFARIAAAIPKTVASETSPLRVALIDLFENPEQLVGELVSAQQGLGYLLQLGNFQYDTPMVFVAVFTLVSLALLLYGVVTLLEKKFLK